MATQWTAWLPALGLLAALALLAWGVQWLRRRQLATGGGAGAALRVTAQLMVGPQQRVVVVELDGPGGAVQLTLGVTPQHVRTLHVAPLGRTAAAPTPATPRYAEVARALADAGTRREPRA
ncbi:flagellar biosynthetic protein FliO [Tepidimonas sediminis]|uniref:Flagellar biosynthetic protein FliO n=1 Tax=Tepidimonas sediminis TaxID=2588941 RepID=A0A554WNP7_9BURK|nr:flagellar biosynthetic protein FliO [Tepidimonas sediminis]TSE25201.1 flagellar biosynthetic protein FliO [Tepidimonas sediminis]